jgi:energy-converting hydrogenase B subunit D
MDLLRCAALVLIAAAGLGVVLTRDRVAQAIAVSLYGLLLALVFSLYQAPDVALSQVVVGAVALPLMILLALAKVRRNTEERRGARP